MHTATRSLVLLALAVSVHAQQTVWGQCGGQGWTGPITCASGSNCVSQNPYYSQCLPGDSPVTTTSRAAVTTTSRVITLSTTRAAVTTTSRAAVTTTRANTGASYTANPNIGPGGSQFVDSPHFRIYGAVGTAATNSLNTLEAAFSCFVDTLGWRSSGLSYTDTTDNDGPFTKVNIYVNDDLPGAAGVMHASLGVSWLEVRAAYTTVPGVVVHEYGHGLTYAAKSWVDQGRTGAWWETVANFVADTYKTSPFCASARSAYGQPTGATDIELNKVISDSFQVLVDGTAGSGNYYQAWPFLAYMTYNPDAFAGLGRDTVRESFARYTLRSNETPLHVFARLSTGASIQRVVGRYWARMAFVDIGHPSAQQVFLNQRSRFNYANLDSQGNGVYRVKSARAPRYMGANIMPLKKTGVVDVVASIASSGSYVATMAVRNTSSGATRYIDFVSGSASASLLVAEEAAVVVANTPALVQYDPFALTAEVNTGLDYTLTLTGASA